MTGLTHRSRPACTSPWPLAGINWHELRRAYKTFLGDPGVGIRHILVAQRRSTWQRWVVRRLDRQVNRQAVHLTGRTIDVNLAQLAQLPPDSLGGAYARHMMGLGLDPAAFIAPEEGRLDQRMAIGHDVYHIITGFDASPLGEFGVAAFTLVQYRDLLNVFVLSFVPISLTNPLWTLPLLGNLWRGWFMGWTCQPLIGYAVEDNWAKPLTLVRQELGLDRYFA